MRWATSVCVGRNKRSSSHCDVPNGSFGAWGEVCSEGGEGGWYGYWEECRRGRFRE